MTPREMGNYRRRGGYASSSKPITELPRVPSGPAPGGKRPGAGAGMSEHSEAEIRGSVARAFDVPERLLGPPSDYLRPLFANPTTRWTPWFAWRPVETSDRGWVWLRWIFRRRCQVKLSPRRRVVVGVYLPDLAGRVYWQTAVDPHLTQMGSR